MKRRNDKTSNTKKQVRSFKGAGLRSENMPQPGHAKHKWRNIRWSVLLFFNFLFFASFYFDIQILEGTLSGSRLLGFHLIDPLAALQLILSSKIIMVNLVIGVVTIVVIYLLFGGRSFCAWICPYHWLAELGEKIHRILKKRKIIKNHPLDRRIRYYFYAFFLALALITGYTVFETVNPVGILSRFTVYGRSLMLLWVAGLLVFEILYCTAAGPGAAICVLWAFPTSLSACFLPCGSSGTGKAARTANAAKPSAWFPMFCMIPSIWANLNM